MAREAIERLGFSPRVGQIISSSGPYQAPLSAETRRAIDDEIRRMVDAAYDDAVALLEDHRDELDGLATVLLEREQVDRGEIEAVLIAVAGGGRRLPARADALPTTRQPTVAVDATPLPPVPEPATAPPRRRLRLPPLRRDRRIRAGAEAAAATIYAMTLARLRRPGVAAARLRTRRRARGPSRGSRSSTVTGEMHPGVDLYWLPLGAGGHSVRLNGRVFEAVVARLERRPTKDLYHSALVVRVPEGEFVIEQAPIRDRNGALRGVVAEGPVGSLWAHSLRIFRYEIRCWRDGEIPDVDEAVDSPQRLTDDPVLAQRFLQLVRNVPTPVWGRDELRAGEMWNSNSITSWLIARSGLGVEAVHPPAGGRAPGWRAGLVVAGREEGATRSDRTV